MKNHMIPMVGRTFERLTVLHRGQKTDKSGQAFWVCRCECGREVEVGGANLRRETARSCGCLRRDAVAAAATTHGSSKTPEYRAWIQMKQRCYSPGTSKYALYGGRGISVCPQWKDDFSAFLRDMGPRPGPGYSVDRKDSDGDYGPENCRWATDTEQNRNTSRNRHLEFRGESRTIAEWAEVFGLPYGVVNHRINVCKWDVEKTLTTPVKVYRPRESRHRGV